MTNWCALFVNAAGCSRAVSTAVFEERLERHDTARPNSATVGSSPRPVTYTAELAVSTRPVDAFSTGSLVGEWW